MSSSVTLGVRLVPSNFQRIRLENIDLASKVDVLKDEAAKKINVEKQTIELMYCGMIMDDDATLSGCGVKSGVMIHVVTRREQETVVPVRPMSEIDVQQLVVAFRAFTLSYGYRTALQRLSRPDVLDNIIASTAGLAQDPVAIAIIQDPELLVHMSDPDTVRRIAELHPSLVEAANHIAAAVHEEANNQTWATSSSGYSYSLEALSDDEEMDSSSSEGAAAPLSRNQSYSAITSAQLAAALANASNNTTTTSTPGGAAAAAANSNSSLITNEMFNQAMQQVFSTQRPDGEAGTAASTTTTTMEEEPFENILRRLAPQLQQMREMGLANYATNIQALQATNGDVQAAIDLVFSGVITE